LKQLTSTLLWELRNETGRKLTPALDQRVDQLEQKLLEKYCTHEIGWYSENLQYNKPFKVWRARWLTPESAFWRQPCARRRQGGGGGGDS
jgi:hypothetical protein